MNTSRMWLVHLPNELLLMILSWLDGLNLGRCSLVCKGLNEVIHGAQDFLWLPLTARLLGTTAKLLKQRNNDTSTHEGGEQEDDWKAKFVGNLLCPHWNHLDTSPGFEVSRDRRTLRRVGSFVIRGWGGIRALKPCHANQFFEGTFTL